MQLARPHAVLISGGKTASDRCERYRRMRLPANVAPGTDLIVVSLTEGVDSVPAPRLLARIAFDTPTVRAPLGPVVEHRRSDRLTFLTAPAPARHDYNSRLVYLNVIAGGQLTLLPSPADEQTRTRRWAVEPTGSELPEMPAVIHALKEAATRLRTISPAADWVRSGER